MLHIPIAPSPPHPDTHIILEIEGDPLPLDSYVKVGEHRECSVTALTPFGGRRMTPSSYDILMKEFYNHSPGIQEKSATYESLEAQLEAKTYGMCFLEYPTNDEAYESGDCDLAQESD